MIKKISVFGLSLATLAVVIFIGSNFHTEFLSAHATVAAKPTIQATSATDVVGTSALLHAIVNNNDGANGHAWFEYGTNPNAATYQESWPGKVGVQSIWDANNMNIAVFLADLNPNTTYYFRMKAENSLGSVTGPIVSFHTTGGTEDRMCANGTTLTRDEARAAMFAKKITTVFSVNGTTHQAQATVTNNTGCALPASIASWKMYDRTLATQVRYDASSVVTIPAHGNHVFSITIPATCMAQIDIFHDVAPSSLQDNNSQNDSALAATFNLNSGTTYSDASGPFCVNTPNPATLKIVKTVINDNGGTKVASDFALYQNSTRVQNGEVKTYTFSTANGTWPVTVSETNLPGYTAGTWGGDCDATGHITLHVGENKICTITNNDNPAVVIPTATLKIIKTVVNDNGGTRQVSDFRLFQDGVEVTSNVDRTYNFATANDNKIITVSENNLAGYTAGTWGGDCAADGHVTLHPGEHKTCRITNNDNPVVTQYGCIAIHKEAYDANNNRINPTPSFTFRLDNNNTIVTDSNGNALVQSVPVGTHTITETIPSGWTLESVTPNTNGTITVGAGSGCANIIFRNKQVQTTTNLAVTCAANTNSALINQTVTYTSNATGGNGSYTYAWTGDENLSGNSNSINKAYSSTGTKNAHLVVTSNGQSISTDCTTVVNNQTSNFSLSCSASVVTALNTQDVTFTAYPVGGNGSYTYLWNGPNIANETSQTIHLVFGDTGYKTMTVNVTSNGQTLSAQCSVNVVPVTLCGSCGGTTQTPVTVIRENGGQVAGVFLSQVPYTGIGSNVKIALFMLALFSWSALVSYIIIKRKAKKHGMTVAQMFQGSSALAYASHGTQTLDPRIAEIGNMKSKAYGTIPVVTNIPRAEINAVPVEPKKSDAIKSPFIEHVQAAPVEAQHVATTVELIDSLEIRARELRTLVSAEGLEIIAQNANKNTFRAIKMLNNMVEVYRGSDIESENDWMVLNTDKIEKMLVA